MQACLDVGRSVLFTGTTGVGKSVITVDALEHLRAAKGVLPHSINFSAQTTSLDTQVPLTACSRWQQLAKTCLCAALRPCTCSSLHSLRDCRAFPTTLS